MKRVLISVDRWGPLVVSFVMLIVLVAALWTYGERISKLEGKVDSMESKFEDYHRTYQTDIIRRDDNLELYKAHVVTLRGEMIKAGLEVPEIPTGATGVSINEITQPTQKKQERH